MFSFNSLNFSHFLFLSLSLSFCLSLTHSFPPLPRSFLLETLSTVYIFPYETFSYFMKKYMFNLHFETLFRFQTISSVFLKYLCSLFFYQFSHEQHRLILWKPLSFFFCVYKSWLVLFVFLLLCFHYSYC